MTFAHHVAGPRPPQSGAGGRRCGGHGSIAGFRVAPGDPGPPAASRSGGTSGPPAGPRSSRGETTRPRSPRHWQPGPGMMGGYTGRTVLPGAPPAFRLAPCPGVKYPPDSPTPDARCRWHRATVLSKRAHCPRRALRPCRRLGMLLRAGRCRPRQLTRRLRPRRRHRALCPLGTMRRRLASTKVRARVGARVRRADLAGMGG